MKKVMQTKLGLGGNCEGATLATLLGLELSEIPDFWEGIDKLNPEAPGAGVLYQDNINYLYYCLKSSNPYDAHIH